MCIVAIPSMATAVIGTECHAALLGAWLACSFDLDCPDKKSHQKAKEDIASANGYELRCQIRDDLETAEDSGIINIIQNIERPLLDGEPQEARFHTYHR